MKEREIITQINSIKPAAQPRKTPVDEQIVELTADDYRLVADTLASRIGSEEYFNGTVECAHDTFYSVLTATLLVYHSASSDREPLDVVPVWWEFHTTLPEGEVMNDFCFATLKEYLLS